MHARRRKTRRPTPVPIPDGLSPAQHQRVKRAHHKYEYTRFQREDAAERNPYRCVCMIDPAVQPESVTLPPASSRRRDPERTAGHRMALHALLDAMRDEEARTTVNALIAEAHARPDAIGDASTFALEGFAELYAWAGKEAPFSARTVSAMRDAAHLNCAGPAPKEPGKAPIFMDRAGAHMYPSCPHSDLWRCTRPTHAILLYFWRSGHWPSDSELRARYGGTPAPEQAKAKPKKRRAA